MTGTPLDLTPFGPLVRGAGLLYWLVALAVALFFVWLFRSRMAKIIAAVLVLAAFGTPVYLHQSSRDDARAQFRAKSAKAKAHFEMRCQSAGERIVRTVDNVDGVVWMKWREPYDAAEPYDQFRMNDPFGRDCHGAQCVQSLLRVTRGAELDPDRKMPVHSGFVFVEAVDPKTAQPRRFIRQLFRPKDRDPSYGAWVVDPELVAEPIDGFTSRYGITWDDISTREDREFWIAGGSLKVIDLQTNEVIAERIGYMWDRGLGDSGGGRQPWTFARDNACPPFPGGMPRWPTTQSVQFVLNVLRPSVGENK
jgi:hypothetical protein